LKEEQGLQYDKSQILVSCGAKHSLYNLAEALLEAGDELIIPVPFWVSYQDQTLLNDATPVLLQTREETGIRSARKRWKPSSRHAPKPSSSTVPVTRPAPPTTKQPSKVLQPQPCATTW
jgi:aspartate/methionine/tyrosine aminotransferase